MANQAMAQLVAQTLSSHVKTDPTKTGPDAQTGAPPAGGDAAGPKSGAEAAATSGGAGAAPGGTAPAPATGAPPPQNPLDKAKLDLTNFLGNDAERATIKAQVQRAQDWESLSGVVVGGLSRDEIIELSGSLVVEVSAGAKRRANRNTLLDAINDALWKCEE